MRPEESEDSRGKQSPLRAIATVLSAFIGIRKSASHQRDLSGLRPVHVIIAGLIAAAVFVLTIVTLVRLIT
jgi:DUF2970 family protein